MAVETENAQTTGGGTETTGAGEHDQFLGIEPDLDAGTTETESTESPETTETEEEGGETTEGGETEETEGDTETEGEEETTEEVTDDNWLPDEQEKQFPLEVLSDYAKRRGYKWTPEQIAGDADIQRLLKDKLNGDIYIRNLEQQDDAGAGLDDNQDETAATEETADTTAATTTSAKDPRAQHYERVDNIVNTVLDQKSTEELGRGLLASMGVNTDVAKLRQMLGSPKLTPEQRVEVQSAITLAEGAGQIGKTIARGGVDLVMTVLPKLLPDLIEQIYPGTRERHEIAIYADAWQRVSRTLGRDQKPLYPNLPAYGTKEFGVLARKTESQLGLGKDGLLRLDVKDDKGNSLPLEQQAMAKYVMVARAAAGQRITPKTVAEAVETGRRQATQTAQKRAAGRALGSGQTSRQFDQTKDEDSVLSDLRKQILQQNEDELPVSNLLSKR